VKPASADIKVTVEHPWLLQGADVASALDADPTGGLTSGEAERRLVECGPNELVERPPKAPWRMLLEQFANTMIVVLIVAAGVTLAIGDLKDTVVILTIVVLNAVIGFVQEYRADRAMIALKGMTAPSARVTRDAVTRVITAREVVPGDILILEAGDVLPADARLLAAPNLRISEAPLTGESIPVEKTIESLAPEAGELVADRTNMAFKGTSVVYGRGRAVVTATGMATAIGEIAGLLQAHQAPRTPLQRRLAGLGRRLAVASLVVCAVVFIVGVARGESASLMFLTAVSLAVAAIPEGLPAVVTISLALGAQRMARDRAIVRKLPAVETLGSVTVVCTDKTGTLTQGRMQVEHAWTFEVEVEVTGSGYEPQGELIANGSPISPVAIPGLRSALTTAALCSDAALLPPSSTGDPWNVAGDPTEGALLALAAKAGFDRRALETEFPRVGEVPFEATAKRMTTLHETTEGDVLVATKGAPEAVLAVTATAAGQGGSRPISDADRERIRAVVEGYSRRGYRVLALAGRRLPSLPGHSADAETDLEFFGLAAMADPLRRESVAAVADCRAAGILPVMITGDHPATAGAIAAKVGFMDDGRILTGDQLSKDGPELLAGEVADITVYARTAPEQKLDIVEAWKSRGDIVAMTGDGVNDAPALRRADIGVAMGATGTEVAKEAADMVIADDNFATIVTAVQEGRRIYDNIRRFVRYMLTANSGEIWVMLIGPFLGLPLPLLPLQILWINLVTDGLPALALGAEPAERDVMRRPPRPPSESIFAHGVWQHVLLVGLLMAAIPLTLGVWGEATGRPWQTMVFTSLACLQLGHTMAVRSETESLFTQGLRSNPFLLAAAGATLLVQLGVIYWPPTQDLLHITALAPQDLAVVLVVSTGVFWAVELEKLVRRRVTARSR
jgi:Ca2+-transporting ATPase